MQLIGRLTLVLWLAVCMTAVAVAYSNYSARLLFSQWQNLLKEQQQYEVEWGQLLIEKSSLTAYTRLEYIAAEKLKMLTPSVDRIHLIKGGVK